MNLFIKKGCNTLEIKYLKNNYLILWLSYQSSEFVRTKIPNLYYLPLLVTLLTTTTTTSWHNKRDGRKWYDYVDSFNTSK